MLTVEIAYATPSKQEIKSLEVPEGTNALDAVKQSGILLSFPEIDIETAKMGTFGKAFSPKLGASGYLLKDGDRVEIYRPLIADPKESRRRRADKA